MRLLFDLLPLQAGRNGQGMARELEFGQAIQNELLRTDGMETLVGTLASECLPMLRMAFCHSDMRWLSLPGAGTEHEAVLRRSWPLLRLDAYRQSEADAIYIGSPLEQTNKMMEMPGSLSVPGKLTVCSLHSLNSLWQQGRKEKQVAVRKGLSRLMSCDLVLAFSEKVRQEAVDRLHLPAEKVVNIGVGAAGQLQGFSWQEAARLALSAIENSLAVLKNEAAVPSKILPERLPRLAWVATCSDTEPVIGAYTETLVPLLQKMYQIDVYLDKLPSLSETVRLSYSVRSWQDLPQRVSGYDLLIYQLGNRLAFSPMLGLIERYGGMAVLHDFYLGGMLDDGSGKEISDKLSARMFQSHGWQGCSYLSKHGTSRAISRYPLNKSVLDLADSIICHSPGAMSNVRKFYGESYAAELDLVEAHVFLGPLAQIPKERCRALSSSYAKEWQERKLRKVAVQQELKRYGDMVALASLYVQCLNKTISKVRQKKVLLELFLNSAGAALAVGDFSWRDCLYLATSYRANHAPKRFRRIYACLSENKFAQLRDGEPQELRTEPLLELVRCSWDRGKLWPGSDLQLGQLSWPIELEPGDVLLLPASLLSSEDFTCGESCAAIYATGTEEELTELKGKGKQGLSGFLNIARLSDFWLWLRFWACCSGRWSI